MTEQGPSTRKRSKLEVSTHARFLTEDVDPRIFTYLNVAHFDTFSFAKFGLLQLGPLCNASTSCAFTEANCDVRTVRNENNLALILDLNQLFTRGVQFLRDLKDKKRHFEEHEVIAIQILDNFFKEKELHEKSLNKILLGHQNYCENKGNSETELTIAYAEHLLGKLAPGKSYAIDARVKRKGRCGCRFDHCESEPLFRSTGIGHEEIWHGFLDIVFPSHCGIPETAASFTCSDESYNSTTPTDQLDDCQNEEDRGSPSGKTISETKLSLSGAENQAIAQTIVFSFVQRQRHPSFSNFLIPNILISPIDFRILMYDAVNDILICSVPLPIFQPFPNSNSLEIASIIILWMVLHHSMFCNGIDTSLVEGRIGDLKKIQANFQDVAKEKFDFYINGSRFGVQGFQDTQRETLPSFETLSLGIHLIPKS